MSSLKTERDRQVQAEFFKRQQALAYRQAQAYLMKGGNPRMLPPNHPVAIAAAAVAQGKAVGAGAVPGSPGAGGSGSQNMQGIQGVPQAGQAGVGVPQVPAPAPPAQNQPTQPPTHPFNSPQLQQAALIGANNANLPPQLQQQVRAMGLGRQGGANATGAPNPQQLQAAQSEQLRQLLAQSMAQQQQQQQNNN